MKPWLRIGLAVVALVPAFAGGAWALTWLEHGPEPLPTSPASDAPPSPAYPVEGFVRVAGSGSNQTVTRMLARAYADAGHERVWVYASIGSTGAIRAVRDGAIDIALISRELRPNEEGLDLAVVPYARVPVVAATHRLVPDDNLSRQDLVDIFAGRRTHWSDGTRIVVLQRDPTDSSQVAMAAALPEFAAVDEESRRNNRFPVVYGDGALEDALAVTPGALGVYGGGSPSDDREFKMLRLDGVAPDLGSVRSGAYWITKDLAFVTVGPATGAAADFVRYCHSPAGREILLRAGYVPLPEDGSP